MSLTKAISNRFALLGFVSACCVAFLHVGVPTVEHSSGWWMYEISQVLCWFAVPFFFLASGFFIAGHFVERDWYGREVQKRVRSILIPFLIWGVLYWLYFLVMGILGDIVQHRPIGGHCSYLFTPGTLVGVFGLDLFHPPFYSVTWFLRALFFLVLWTPILERITRKRAWCTVVVLYAATLYLKMCPSHFGQFCGLFSSVLPLEGAAWFSLGLAIRLERIKLPGVGKPIIIAVISLFVAAASAIISACFGCRTVFMSLASPFMILGLWLVLPCLPIHSPLPSPFALYLLHTFFLSGFSIFVNGTTDMCCWMLVRVVFAIGGSVLFAMGLRAALPRVSAFLFGGR